MKPSAVVLAAALAAAGIAPAHADTLLIQRTEAATGMVLPSRGQSMAQVEAKFGAPDAKHAPVGGGSVHTPPITRWSYATFTVYFENDHVIKAVVNRAHANELGPKPIQ